MFKRNHNKTRPYIRKIKTVDMIAEEILVKEIAKNPYLGLRIALKGQRIDIPAEEDVLAAAEDKEFRNMIRSDPKFRLQIKQSYLSKIKITPNSTGELDDMINKSTMEKLRNDPALANKFRRRVSKEIKKCSTRAPYGYLKDLAKFKKVIESLTGIKTGSMGDNSQEDTDNTFTMSSEENEIAGTADDDTEN